MKLYDCRVRLAGSRDHEVPKFGVTAAEIAILQVMHGEDAVTHVTSTDKVAYRQADLDDRTRTKKPRGRTDREERERLQELYGPALAKNEDIRTINGIFGPTGALPTAPVLAGDMEVDGDDEEDEDEDVVAGYVGSPRETVQRSATASATRDDINNDPGNLALLRVKEPVDVGPKAVDRRSTKEAAAAALKKAQDGKASRAVTAEAQGVVQDTDTRKEADKETGEKVDQAAKDAAENEDI